MTENNSVLRLNKFVAKSGICNRKEAVELIKKGSITVNGKILKEPFYEVRPNDVIVYKGKILVQEQKFVYILLNKPKDIGVEENNILRKPSTGDLIKKLTDQKVTQLFPIEDTSSGLTILTNDLDLIKKYSDTPKRSKTVFEIELDKPIEAPELAEIGVNTLSDNVFVSGISCIEGKPGNYIGIEILSGTDRDIKQLFITRGYTVLRIDRTFMNGFTKKDLKRGWSRLLTSQEVIFLKFF